MIFARRKFHPINSVADTQDAKVMRRRRRSDHPSARASNLPPVMSHFLLPHQTEDLTNEEPATAPESPKVPCEDEKVSRDEELPLFPRVLKAHRTFRSRLYYSLGAIFLTILVATTVVAYAPTILRNVGFQQQQARTLGVAAAAFSGMSVLSLIWLIGLQITERRFSLISQHAAIASRSLGVDDPQEAPAAVETLIETFTYQQVLVRWLRDLRWVTGIAGIMWGLFQAVIAEFLGIDGLFAVVMSGITPTIFYLYTSSLIRKAESSSELDPADALKDRVGELIVEVRDLRRGVRQIV